MANEFRFVLTEDGSPTLELLKPDGVREKMHHFRGAYSETGHVYGKALDLAVQKGWPLRVLSLGLGLAYNEIMVGAALASLEAQGQKPMAYVQSFEREGFLSEMFFKWVDEFDRLELQDLDGFSLPDTEWSQNEMNAPHFENFKRAYNHILLRFSGHYKINPGKVILKLKMMLEKRELIVRESYTAQSGTLGEKFSVFFYDAFSDKVDADLWDGDLLRRTLQASALPQAVFATYAAKGVLKKTLKEFDFVLEDMAGFGGKRECTFAIRE